MNKSKKPKKCLICNKEFIYNRNKTQKYCSQQCYYESIRRTRKKHYCQNCGTECKCRRIYCNKCYKDWLKKHNKKILTNRWDGRGQRCHDGNGYILFQNIKHPNSNKRGYLYEHRLVMESFLNKISFKKWIKFGRTGNYPTNARFLTKKEIVHHINGIKTDNRIENLMLFPNRKAHHQFKHFNKLTFICKFCRKNQKDK